MKVHLQYGRDGLVVEIPGEDVTVIEPRFVPGLSDERAAFLEAVRRPIGGRPLRETVKPRERLAVVVPDLTRPLPSDRLLPWLFEELAHVPPDRVVIVNGTGSHRTNTPDELASMLGRDIVGRYRVVNHSAHGPLTADRAEHRRSERSVTALGKRNSHSARFDTTAGASKRAVHEASEASPPPLLAVGRSLDGETVYLNREYVEADRRIVLGFIEPHFMAGFSGGYKGVFPAVGDIASIMRYHDARTIGHPRSTWGLLEGNPTQETIRHNGSLLPVDFCVNVTLNRRREITRFFCGEVLPAHEAGCAFSKATAMVACPRRFPIVVTTNSGYPLDQNLYQTVKGMSAAAQIVAEGGYVVTAARCDDGFPEHGNFKALLFRHETPRELLDTIEAPGFSIFDQWEAQLLAIIRLRARVALLSELSGEDVRRAHLEPIADVSEAVRRELARLGPDAPVAVLPEGPQTIPYVS